MVSRWKQGSIVNTLKMNGAGQDRYPRQIGILGYYLGFDTDELRRQDMILRGMIATIVWNTPKGNSIRLCAFMS